MRPWTCKMTCETGMLEIDSGHLVEPRSELCALIHQPCVPGDLCMIRAQEPSNAKCSVQSGIYHLVLTHRNVLKYISTTVTMTTHRISWWNRETTFWVSQLMISSILN